jgi:hypothetical protein
MPRRTGWWIRPSHPFDREAIEPSERPKPGGKKPRRHRSAVSGIGRLPEAAQRSKAMEVLHMFFSYCTRKMILSRNPIQKAAD